MTTSEIEYILLQYIDATRSELATADRLEVDGVWDKLFADGLLKEVEMVAYTGDEDLVEHKRKTRTAAGATRLTELKRMLGK
jgi:hypothetical protein